MRLTLRTMLAYMDDILEPTDAEDIRKKMEDSKFASELAQRIRDSVRMLRLPAPPLQGRGLGLDANSVAKYLDNELPGERVADFEKICLESDKHLAEVASCHQILTLVLGEPADVDPAARERMYGLIDQAEPLAPPPQAPLVAPPKGAGALTAAASSANGPQASSPQSGVAQTGAAASVTLAEPAAGRRAKPEVPDYLREKHASRIWPVAAVMLVAFVLTAGVFWMIAPPQWREQALGWFHGEPAVEGDTQIASAGAPSDADASGVGGDKAGAAAKVADKDGAAPAAGSGDAANAAGSGDKVNAAGSSDAGKSAGSSVGGATADGVPADGPKMAAGEPTLADPNGAAPTNPDIVLPAGNSAIGDPANSDPASAAGQPPVATPTPGSPDGAAPAGAVSNSLPGGGAAGVGAPGLGDLAASRPDQMPDAVASATPAGTPIVPGNSPLGPPGEAPAVGGGAPPAAPWHVGEEMGRYTSEQDVLLKRDTASRTWKRLPPKSPIVAGDLLLSLPAYRPVFNLVTGVNVQAVGPSEFGIRGIDTRGVPTIAIRYGRLIALTIGKASNQIRIEFGERSGLITFGDTNSALAIEVDEVLTPGSDPETEVAPTIARIFATSGSIRWEENGQPEAIIQAPAGRTLAPLPLAELAGTELPKWVGADSLMYADKIGAEGIEKELTSDRTISLAIKELAENRKIEIRTLATRCAGYVGQFEPSVASFNNADQHNDWPKHIEALRSALARGPETAAQVRAAFEKHRGPDADKLYRMLWGYTPEQLKEGAAQQLVEDLNSDSLDIRVLSFWNLQNMTGLSLFYKPEHSAAKRRPAYMKWKERWKEGKLFTAASAKAGSRATRPPAETPEP